MEQQTKAILVISFGTSHEDTRKKTIDKIEEKIQQGYPEYRIYRAWTSNMIRKKLKNRDGVHVDSIEEAFGRMKQDGISEVIVQTTHVINGIETEYMWEKINEMSAGFASVKTGAALLTSSEDLKEVAGFLSEKWGNLPPNEAVVLMGHGTPHEANQIYLTLDETLKKSGHENMFIGTVEGYPSIEDAVEEVKKYEIEKVHLAPFMIVAGDHAKNDMAGEGEDSWRNQFQKEGFSVECHMAGLGEYEEIQSMFVRHVREA